jgi:hypothetical protein
MPIGRPDKTEWLEINGLHQLPVHTADVNILGANVYTLNTKIEALEVASKKVGLGVKVNETKYAIMFQVQNAERSHYIKFRNSCFEREKQCKLLFFLDFRLSPCSVLSMSKWT